MTRTEAAAALLGHGASTDLVLALVVVMPDGTATVLSSEVDDQTVRRVVHLLTGSAQETADPAAPVPQFIMDFARQAALRDMQHVEHDRP